jgi:RHS repeat-associated protein
MTDDGIRRFVWNDADELVSVARAGEGSMDSVFGSEGVRRVRVERHADGTTTTTRFVDAWSEERDGKLLRYIVHGGQRVVQLGDANAGAGEGPKRVLAHRGSAAAQPASAPSTALLLITAFAIAAALLQRGHRRPGTHATSRVVAIGSLLGVAVACAGDMPRAAPPGAIGRLGANDTILVTDLLGSVLGEATPDGKETSQFATYPFGRTRYDTAHTTWKYAGSPRDGAVGLDHMGARFYAPELGLWTSGDPVLVHAPERLVTPDFAAANPYAYAKQSPVVAADRDGHFWHIAIGAAVGALVGGGIEAGRQFFEHGRVDDWGRVGAAAVAGSVAGAITAAYPVVTLQGALGVGAASNTAAGIAERLVASGGKSAGTLATVATDAVVGAATAGVARGVMAGGSRALRQLSCPVANGELNDVPTRLARVVPLRHAASDTLAETGEQEAWVTAAEDLKGVRTSHGLASRLSLISNNGRFIEEQRVVLEFDAPAETLASPVARDNPGFVGRGFTGGRAREFVMPNVKIDDLPNMTSRIVP